MSGYPGSLNLLATQGATFRTFLTWAIEGVAVNLTGATAKLTVRKSITDTATVVVLTEAAGLTLGGTAGTIAVHIDEAVTATIPPGSYVWDLFVTISGDVTPLTAGQLSVRQAVTRG